MVVDGNLSWKYRSVRGVFYGLISSKVSDIEPMDILSSRIEEASRFVSLDRLCLSPQCGFASTAPGNPLSFDDQ